MPLALLFSALELHKTMVMTLQLAEKCLSRVSGLQDFQPGPDQRSSSSPTINDRDPLRDSMLWESQLFSLASSRHTFTQSSWSSDRCPPTYQRLWILSALQASKFSRFPPAFSLGGAFTRSQWSFNACPLESKVDIYSSLQDLGSFNPMQLNTPFPSRVPSLSNCTVCRHVEKWWNQTRSPIRRVTCVVF